MRSDLDSWSPQLFVVDRGRTERNWAVPRCQAHGAGIMRPVVLAQCACCSRLPPHLWCWRHLARLRCAGGIPVGRPWATGKALRCDSSRSTDAPWAQRMPREPAITALSAGTTSSNVALTGDGSHCGLSRTALAVNQWVTKRSQVSADGAGVRE